MSNYSELRAISKKYKGKEVYTIAADLGIAIKSEEDCLKDFNNSCPLKNRNAVLTLAGGRYIIYCKPCEYDEYYILHEICHYLFKHNADGEYEENQSNILACMILIPDKSINNDVHELSELYNIPVEMVILYIKYLKSNTNIYKRRKVIVVTSITITACALFVSGTILGAVVFNNNTPDIIPVAATETDTEITSEQPVALTTQAQSTDNNTVYVTKSGTKYHKQDCYYIRGRNTLAITLNEANNQGYLPCSVCYKK